MPSETSVANPRILDLCSIGRNLTHLFSPNFIFVLIVPFVVFSFVYNTTKGTKDAKELEEETRTARARQVCCVDHRRNDLSLRHGDTEIKKDGSEEQKSDPFVFPKMG